MSQSLVSNPNTVALIAGIGLMLYSRGLEIPSAIFLIIFAYLAQKQPKRTLSIYLTAVFNLFLWMEWGPWWLCVLVIFRSALTLWAGEKADQVLLFFAIYLLFGPHLMGELGLGWVGTPLSLIFALALSVREIWRIFQIVFRKLFLKLSS